MDPDLLRARRAAPRGGHRPGRRRTSVDPTGVLPSGRAPRRIGAASRRSYTSKGESAQDLETATRSLIKHRQLGIEDDGLGAEGSYGLRELGKTLGELLALSADELDGGK